MENSHQVNLTFFGGINEIGGNCVLLEDAGYDVKLIIDFGINFDKYFNHFHGEDPFTLQELIKVRLIPKKSEPKLKNLYSKHYLFNPSKKSRQQKVAECQHQTDPPTDIDGVLISHPHRDHYYGLPLLNRNIPIYTGATTRKIILAHYDSSRYQMDNFYEGLQWRVFRTGNVIEKKGMKITPVHVDHSIPGAYGFIFETSAGVIVYSGDFRMHGPLSWMTADLIRKAREITGEESRVKGLICEGTFIHKGSIESEAAVKRQLKTLFRDMPFDYVLVKYDRVDWDRFRTYAHIAKRFQWNYIITEKDAYFYYLLNSKDPHPTMRDPDIQQDDHILILSDGKARFPWQQKIRRIFENLGKEERLIEYKDLRGLKGHFFLYLTSLYRLIKDNLPLHLKGVFIASTIDPYAEEFRDNTKTIQHLLLEKNIPAYRILASGHAKPHDIYKFVKGIDPETLIPVHTQHPALFKKLLEEETTKVLLPDDDLGAFEVKYGSEG